MNPTKDLSNTGTRWASLGYREDIRLENRFTKTVKSILGNQFVVQDETSDQQYGTDFMLLTFKPFTVAVRLRTFKYWQQYPNDFTIRWQRPSGVATEIDKIRAGHVDYLLYGFVDQREKNIVQYFIGDLSVFREYEPEPKAIYENTPPDSKLAVFGLDQLPPGFVVKMWP